MVRKRIMYVTYLIALVILVVAVNFTVGVFFASFIELSLSLSIASAISIGVQIISTFRSMPELEIRYVPDRDHELYELYHHKDVPLGDSTAGEYGNYLLIGLANIGKSIARNCYVILWIYTKSDFLRPVDNPFPLYWSHDPNSKLPNPRPPEYYGIAPEDERFLGICHFVKSSNKFYFDDYGQQVSNRRQRTISGILFNEPVLYIKVVAYCENGDSIRGFFKITKKDYNGLAMEKYPFVKST